jgi:hypothetical protein
MTNLIRVICLLASAALLPSGAAAQQSGGAVAAGGRGSARVGGVSVADTANMPAPQGFSVVLVLGEMQGTGAADSVPSAARKALTDMKDFLPYKTYRLLDTQWTLCCGRSGVITRLRGPEEQDYDLELYPNATETRGKWYVRFALRDSAEGANEETATTRLSALNAQRVELQQQLAMLKNGGHTDNHPAVQQLRSRIAELDAAATQSRGESASRRIRAAAESGHRRAIIDTSFTMDIGETVVVGTSRLKGDKALIALLTAVPSTRPPAR